MTLARVAGKDDEGEGAWLTITITVTVVGGSNGDWRGLRAEVTIDAMLERRAGFWDENGEKALKMGKTKRVGIACCMLITSILMGTNRRHCFCFAAQL
ncbi:hypothetical protein BHE74_00038573 [Ensete ventricosum]|nr:hypothetical protein BHE74_00038573 [Ensete ventricosum]